MSSHYSYTIKAGPSTSELISPKTAQTGEHVYLSLRELLRLQGESYCAHFICFNFSFLGFPDFLVPVGVLRDVKRQIGNAGIFFFLKFNLNF